MVHKYHFPLPGKQKKHMMGWNEITGVKIHDYTDFEDAASGASLAEGTIVHFGEETLL